MRSFIISLILLVTVTAGIMANSVYGTAVYNEMLNLLDELPQTADSANNAIHEANEYFEKHRNYVYCTVCEATANELYCDLAEACAYYYAGDTFSYLACKQKASFRVRMLRNCEKNPFSQYIIDAFGIDL